MSEMNGTMTMEAEVVEAVKRDYSKLPKALVASIHVDGNSGKKSDGKYTASAFIIMVKAVNPKTGREEWHPENEWLHMSGMKCKSRTYANSKAGGVEVSGFEKAKTAKAEILAKWGVAAAEKAKKAKVTKADLEKANAAMAAKIADLEAKMAAMMKVS